MAKYDKYNFTIYQGETSTPILQFFSEDSEGNKTPIMYDSTNDFVMTLKSGLSENMADKLANHISMDLPVVSSRIIIGNVRESDNEFVPASKGNAIELIFPHEVTEQFKQPSYEYDLFMIIDNKEYKLLSYGTINVIKSVTYGTY